jgi:vitamin B12 transporter
MIRRTLSGFVLLAVFLVFSYAASAETDLEKIVVRAVPYGSVAAGPVSAVLTQDQINNIPAETPQDLLRHIGVDVQSRGNSGVKSDISLNAGTFQQALILVNGSRINDSQTAHHNLDLFFNLEDIERVELIPAANSAKYGPDGIAGAINFVLKTPAQEESSLSAAFGSNDIFEQKCDMAYGAGALRHRLSASRAQSDGPRFDTDYRADTYFHSTAWQKEDAALFLDAGYNQKEFGAYDFYTPGRGYASKEWTDTLFVNTRGLLKNKNMALEPRLEYRRHNDKFILDITNPVPFTNRHRTDSYQAGAVATFPAEEAMFSVGADYGEERIASGNLGDHVRGHWDLFFDPTWQLSPETSLNAMARVDSYTTFSEAWAGSLSLKHAFRNGSDVYATFGRTVRVPTFTELYYSDPTTAGDPALKPEYALNFESGWNKKIGGDFDLSFSLFTRRECDTIDFTKWATTDPKFIARNISRATAFGSQAYARWQAAETRFFDLRYAYADKILDDNKLIFKYGLNFTNHMVATGWDQDFSFGHNRLDFIMKKKPGRRAWFLDNDRLSVDIKKAWQVFVEVYNLGNAEYQEIEGIAESGRLFKIGTKLTW